MNADEKPRHDDDIPLIRRCGWERDENAFDLLADRYREPLRRYLRGLLPAGDAAAADDLLQETLLRLWMHAPDFDGRGPVKAWLFRIAANLASNYRRAVQRRHESPLLFSISSSAAEDRPDCDAAIPSWLIDRSAIGPESAAIQSDERRRLCRLLDELPTHSRDVWRLVHDDELDLRTVARLLDIPEGTVKSRLFHTRKRLARAWNSQRADSLAEGND